MNKRGKQLERTAKLTNDSLLTLSGKKIKLEVPLAGVENVTSDPNDQEIISIQIKVQFLL